MNFNFVELTGLLLFIIGLYGLAARRNIIKAVLSLGVIDVGIITFFLGIRFQPTSRPPIGQGAAQAMTADPIPQALMITAIVIGIAVTAAALTMFSALYHRYGSTNWRTVYKIRKEERKR